MPHIHDKPGQHDHVVDMFIFRTDFQEPKVMLHVHRKHHILLQFGGHVELDEHPMQTMEHELKEETGYDTRQLKILQPKGSPTHLDGIVVHPIPAIYNTHHVIDQHSHIASYYVLTTDQPPADAPKEGESTEILLFTRQEIIAMPDEEIGRGSKGVILYMFDHILTNWEPVELSSYQV